MCNAYFVFTTVSEDGVVEIQSGRASHTCVKVEGGRRIANQHHSPMFRGGGRDRSGPAAVLPPSHLASAGPPFGSAVPATSKDEELLMRMLMHVDLPLEPFNTAVRDGTAGEKIQRILAALEPEAAYFSEQDGKRGGVLVVDVESPADVPRLAEPWFLTFDASVQFRVCMTPEDLGRAGLDELGAEWR